MGRKRKKPDFDQQADIKDLVTEVAEYYGTSVSIREVADHFGITLLKARKILITAGVYSTMLSRRVQEMTDEGKTVAEIMRELDLSRASVSSYLPYKRVIYKMPTLSVGADRKKMQRFRQKSCEEFVEKLETMNMEEAEEGIKHLLDIHQGCVFYTPNGERYSYRCEDGLIYIRRKPEKVEDALNDEQHKPEQLTDIRLDELEDRASYVYPIFKRFKLV
ncbi:MAG: hypothetical protein K6C35_00100 [Eubacterium sp.]|nr:hypothetical protein [Eubacterium sp.]